MEEIRVDWVLENLEDKVLVDKEVTCYSPLGKRARHTVLASQSALDKRVRHTVLARHQEILLVYSKKVAQGSKGGIVMVVKVELDLVRVIRDFLLVYSKMGDQGSMGGIVMVVKVELDLVRAIRDFLLGYSKMEGQGSKGGIVVVVKVELDLVQAILDFLLPFLQVISLLALARLVSQFQEVESQGQSLLLGDQRDPQFH
jgi:hypothetical protein